jgi:hypothetical protein
MRLSDRMQYGHERLAVFHEGADLVFHDREYSRFFSCFFYEPRGRIARDN